MAARGRPPKLGYRERVGYVVMLLKASRLACVFARGSAQMTAADLTARQRQDLAKLPAPVRQLVQAPAGKHRRYADIKLLNYAKHPPRSGEFWRLTGNYRPAGGNSEEQTNYDLINEWRQTVYGPRVAGVARRLVEEGWARDREIPMPGVLWRDYPPQQVGRVSGQIEIAIARIAGVSPRTLRHWRRQYETSDLMRRAT
jgi:hypothetical protein